MKLTGRFIFISCALMSLLVIPFLATIFSTEFNWSKSDFFVMSALFIGLALMVEFILQCFTSTVWRVLLIALALFIIVMFWAELAVGIFGTPFAGS